MKISLKKLREIVNEHAYHLKEMAGYSGSNNDGGCEKVLNQLKEFEYSIIVEKDLRPSEYSVLNDLEVDEPIIFKTIIEEYKLKLAMEIVKTMKL